MGAASDGVRAVVIVKMDLEQVQQQEPVLEQVFNFFRTKKTEIARFGSAITMFLWGLVLLAPGDTFAHSPNLRYLAFWHEEVWAAILLIVAVFTYLSARYEWTKIHAVVLAMAMAWWIWLTCSIAIAVFVREVALSTGIAAYSGFSILATLSFLRYMATHNVIRRRGE